MRITEIKFMERINLGNYEHREVTATAVIEETEDVYKAMSVLSTYVKESLHPTTAPVEAPPVKEEPVKEEVVKEEPKKVVKKVAKKEVAEKKVSYTPYSSGIPGHKTILSSYLTKKYDSAWSTVKPKEEIKAFTQSLNGKDFLDDTGSIVISFLETLHSFFGA